MKALARGVKWLCWAGLLQLHWGAMAEVVNEPVKAAIPGPGIEPAKALESPREGFAERISLFQEREPTATWLKFGELLLSPTYSQSSTYNDNVLGQPADSQKQDFQVNYAPRLAVRYAPSRDFTFDGGYGFGWHTYANQVARHYMTHDADGALNWNRVGLDGLSLRCDGSYQQTGNTGVLVQDFVAFNRLHAYNFGPTLAYRLNRLAVVLNYQYAETHYFERRNLINDFSSHAGTAVLSYRLTERGLAAYASYSAKSFQTLDPVTGDCVVQEGRVGLQGVYRKLEFRFGVGENSASYAQPSLRDKIKPGAAMGLRYSPNRIVSCELGASRAFVVGPLSGSTTNTQLNGTVVLDLSKFDRVTLFTAWTDEDYGTRRRDTLLYGVRYDRPLTRNMKLLAQVDRTERTVSLQPDVKMTTATIGLTLGF